MKQLFRTTQIYGLTILVISAWWILAFKRTDHSGQAPTSLSIPRHDSTSYLLSNYIQLSVLDRDQLLRALSGDFALMASLIREWEIDSGLLEQNGLQKIQHLSPSDFLRSQTVARQLERGNTIPEYSEKSGQPPPYVIDDVGKRIDLKHSYQRFIPQTYAAANFLLALSPAEQIVALHPFFREQTQIHPKELTDRIPLNVDRQNGEKLFMAAPDVAFIAHYSNPATTQALANQGITLYMMRDLNTLEDIQNELSNIGTLIQRPLHADLLRLFIKAAIFAIDNRLVLLEDHFSQILSPPPRFMMLSLHKSFSVPTAKTLTGQLLARMAPFDRSLEYAKANGPLSGWSVPIDKERLLNINPDYLIISTENSEGVFQEVFNDAALQKLSAVKNQKIFFIDESIQNDTSQYAVLAYFDLVQALENLQ